MITATRAVCSLHPARVWARWLLAIFLGILAIAGHAEAGERDLTIVAGGDVAWPRGWAEGPTAAAGAKGPFALIAPYLQDADLRFVNLETPLTDRPFQVKKRFLVATTPTRLQWLLDAGFNLLSLANNHTADAGVEGIADTLQALEAARASGRPLWWTGAHTDPAQAAAPVVWAPPGKSLRVAFLAFGNNASRHVASVFAASAVERIRAARREAGFVIVSVHAGGEYQHVAEPALARRMRAFVDAGADLVLGHHPHVVRGIERRGKSLIFYSLGNFSFSSYTTRHHATGARLYGILPIIEVKDGAIAQARIVPLYVNNREPWQLEGQAPVRPTPMRPQPLRGAYATAMLTELQQWSAAIVGNETAIAIVGDEGRITL